MVRTADRRDEPHAPVTITDDLVMLPIQFATPARSKLDGALNLMAAVLADGVQSFCKTADATAGRRLRLHLETADWVFSDDRSRLFSFLNLCDVLDVDAGAIRESLLRWKWRAGRSRREEGGPGLARMPRRRAA